MSTALTMPCTSCAAELAAGLLACPGCGWLVHREQLVTLARAADEAERAGETSSAMAHLRSALDLLPSGVQQRSVIEARLAKLGAQVDGRAPRSNKGVAGKLAGLGVVGLVLLKSKSLLGLLLGHGKLLLLGLTKLPTLLSMLLYARWSGTNEVALTLGVVASIYVHEVGHVAALHRYGIAATAPMFIPGFGALVRMKQYPTNVHEEARTGLTGPLWGLAAALCALAFGKLAGSSTGLAVAGFGAALNLFNLVPVWQLDGARGLRALSRRDRFIVGFSALGIALLVRQWLPAVVGAVVLLRAAPAPEAPVEDRGMLLLFVALVVSHALVIYLAA